MEHNRSSGSHHEFLALSFVQSRRSLGNIVTSKLDSVTPAYMEILVGDAVLQDKVVYNALIMGSP